MLKINYCTWMILTSISVALATQVAAECNEKLCDMNWWQEASFDDVKAELNAGADIMARDEGTTPLHYAAMFKGAEVVQLMVDAGADVNAVGNSNLTPLHYNLFGAYYRGSAAVIRVLIAGGADISARDNRGMTPLHIAVNDWNMNYVHSEPVKILLELGADISALDNNGNTPLHLAANKGMSESILVLLAADADATVKNKDGETSLDLARNYAKLFDTGYVTTRNGRESFKNTDGYMALEKAIND